MAFARSVTSLFRTSRALNARGANPINRVFGHERFGARAYAAAFQRDKPHVNIGMSKSGIV
jgi:elongation factor Tu